MVRADGQMISGHFNWPMKKKTHTHTHTNTKKAPQKEKGNSEAGRAFFFTFHFFGIATLVTNVSFFLSFISSILKIWRNLTKKIAKLSPNLH